MNPEILICSHVEAFRLNRYYDAALSVMHAKPSFSHNNHLFVQFDDYPREEWGGPTRADIQQIINWADTRSGGSLLVHCAAGISRSTASAIGICSLWGMSTEDAWNHVYSSRPAQAFAEPRPFEPNPLVLKHFDDLLGTDLLSLSPREMELRSLR